MDVGVFELFRIRIGPSLALHGDGSHRVSLGQAIIELTHNWGVERYELGTAYGHIAIQVDDIHSACKRVRTLGGKVTREPGPMKHGTTNLAFVEDPDGYRVEFIQR